MASIEEAIDARSDAPRSSVDGAFEPAATSTGISLAALCIAAMCVAFHRRHVHGGLGQGQLAPAK